MKELNQYQKLKLRRIAMRFKHILIMLVLKNPEIGCYWGTSITKVYVSKYL